MNIHETIKAARKAHNLTQEQLSEGICTRTTLSRFEGGKTNISTSVLEKLMDKLNLKIQ